MPVISKITGAPFRFWCQKVLPAVYDDSLSYYELLCKVVDYLNKVMEDDINVVNLVNELEEFVNNYFDNLDVQEEINNKLDAMAEDGSLIGIIAPHLDPIIEDYESQLDEDLAEYKETMDADVADFKSTVNDAIDAQDTDIENFKNTVTGQVSAQNTEIADFKSSVNTSTAEQDSDISVMQSQMSNFIDSYSDIQTFTDLYTATATNGLHYINQTIDLSDAFTDYEELDIYWSYNSDKKVIRVKSADLLSDGAYISWYVDKSPDTGIPAPMYIALMKLVNGNAAHTQLTLGEAYSEEWNGLAASDATRDKATTASEYTAGEVYKIVGITYTTSAELTDIRVGYDSTVYPTAGDAVRGQFSDLNTALTAVENMTDLTVRINDWTMGRRSTGALNDYYYTSEIVKTPCEISFDDTNYQISFVRCNVDGSVHGSGATWRTTSPVTIGANTTYDYCWIEIQHLVTQTSITESDLAAIKANTFHTTHIPIVETIKNTLTSAYVDGVNGLDTNDGSATHPYKTIQKAVDSGRNTVFVATGVYNEFVFIQDRERLSILPWSYSSTFDQLVPDTPKIEITGGTCAIRAYDCGTLEIIGVYGHDTTKSVFEIFRCKNVEMVNCWASDVEDTEYNGFKIASTNGVFRNCQAWDIGRDGFGISIYGNTEFIDCIAHDCGDDGISHHDGCTGVVIGGEYYNCGKGGVATPTYGSYIDVTNVYAHDNVYGLYSVTDSSRRRSKARVSGCVFKNNSTKDIYINNNDLVGWNNVYDSKSLINQATFIEY